MASSYTPDIKHLLTKSGCTHHRPGKGDHEIWFGPITQRYFTVDGKIKSRHTASAIMKQAGIDRKFCPLTRYNSRFVSSWGTQTRKALSFFHVTALSPWPATGPAIQRRASARRMLCSHGRREPSLADARGAPITQYAVR